MFFSLRRVIVKQVVFTVFLKVNLQLFLNVSFNFYNFSKENRSKHEEDFQSAHLSKTFNRLNLRVFIPFLHLSLNMSRSLCLLSCKENFPLLNILYPKTRYHTRCKCPLNFEVYTVENIKKMKVDELDAFLRILHEPMSGSRSAKLRRALHLYKKRCDQEKGLEVEESDSEYQLYIENVNYNFLNKPFVNFFQK